MGPLLSREATPAQPILFQFRPLSLWLCRHEDARSSCGGGFVFFLPTLVMPARCPHQDGGLWKLSLLSHRYMFSCQTSRVFVIDSHTNGYNGFKRIPYSRRSILKIVCHVRMIQQSSPVCVVGRLFNTRML